MHPTRRCNRSKPSPANLWIHTRINCATWPNLWKKKKNKENVANFCARKINKKMDSFDKSLSWWRDYDDDLSLSAGLTFRQKFALKRYASGNLSKLDVDTNRTLMCSADGKKLKLRA